jgi:molybdenum cofactor guanylyltransferase
VERRLKTDNGSINGLILNGGRSSRMGFDKSTVVFHGKPQHLYLNELLKKFCANVFISLRNFSGGVSATPFLIDKFDTDSPLNGILTAMDHDPDSAWLTVPIDMPGVDETVIRYLVDHRDPSSVATCFLDQEGKLPEPLVTIWETASHALLMDFYNSGGKSPRAFLSRSKVNLLRAPSVDFHTNINSPDDLRKYRGEH